ncbi:hypothetical protein D3C73_510000 [compost metagenome]
MNFDLQMAENIQKYLKEVKGEEFEISEILGRPRWKRVWFWWQAIEYYEGRKMPNLTLEEVKNIYGDK